MYGEWGENNICYLVGEHISSPIWHLQLTRHYLALAVAWLGCLKGGYPEDSVV
jgi:hypothetical protein